MARAIAFAQGTSLEERYLRVDSFDAYKDNLRPLDATVKKACESRLQRILEAIDRRPSPRSPGGPSTILARQLRSWRNSPRARATAQPRFAEHSTVDARCQPKCGAKGL